MVELYHSFDPSGLGFFRKALDFPDVSRLHLAASRHDSTRV